MARISRVKKLMLRIRVCFAASVFSLWSKIRAFLLRARTFLLSSRIARKLASIVVSFLSSRIARKLASITSAFCNRCGLVAAARWIKRQLKTLWACRPKRSVLPKLVVLVLVVYTCSPTSSFYPALDSTPKVSAEWVLPRLAGYHIGEPFEATLKITSPVALFVDPDSLRQEGETFGNFEVWGRDGPRIYYIKEESEVQKVTEFYYTLLYLKPLDEGVFAKRAFPPAYFDYRYRRQYSSGVYWVEGKAHAEKTELYLTKRVQPGDQPFPLAGEVPEGRSLGWLLKAIGAVIVFAVPIFHLARFICTRRSRPKPVPLEPEISPADQIKELRERWRQTRDYRYFLQAALWARIWKKEILGLKPGALLPQDELWRLTTFVLCSGKLVSELQIEGGFTLFLELYSCKTDPEQLPLPPELKRANPLKRLLRRVRGKGGKDEV